MKSFTLFLFLFIVSINISTFSQTTSDEYGTQNRNAYLGGLGLTISYVNVPSHPDFNIDTAGTLEMWIYPTLTSGNSKCIIAKGAGTNVSFLFGINGSTGRLFLRIGSTNFLNNDGALLSLNQWSHVAVTWTGGPNYTVSFYINGLLSGTPVNSAATFSINSDALTIGGSQAYTTYAFSGNIDEVRVWKYSKNSNQILCNRFVGLGDGENSNYLNNITSSSFYSGLVSSWTFNSSGTTAFDYIGYHNGTYLGSAASTQTVLGVPMPYNFVLKLSGGPFDFITIPTNTTFNQSSDGTIEMWFKPASFTTEQVLFSKGNSVSTLSFTLGIAPGGKLYFGTGTNITINTTGSALTLNQWNHIAVTWATVGTTFEVKFYKNGTQNGAASTIPNSFPVNTDAALIGNSGIYSLPARGFIDEVHLWNPRLTEQQIKTNMFVSGRSLLPNASILGLWNFDGNLNNFSSVAGINASFNSGSVNNSRLSGYANDSAAGPYGNSFQSHSTVINRASAPNPFPVNYYCKTTFKAIPDNNVNGVTDTIISVSSGYVTGVELFISIQHTYVGDLKITLKAPNEISRNIIVNNGGAGKNILTFFADDFAYMPTDNYYLPPWGYIKSMSSLGSFGTYASGNWVLTCVDNAANDAGILQGWGLKFTTISGINHTGTPPSKYMLGQNYPNPFNPATSIKFDIKKSGNVSLKIYNSLGREVKTLINGNMDAGSYSIDWNASSFSSGVYFYKLESGEFTDVKKMLLIK